MQQNPKLATLAVMTASLMAACAGDPLPHGTPLVTPKTALPGSPAMTCEALTKAFQWPSARVVSAEVVAEGAVKPPGITAPVPEHCRVTGRLAERTSPVDGKPYWIGFEMRLPAAWNGRFFYQANGGLDGFVTPAFGDTLGGGPRSNGLVKGFAVMSSDAGHVLDVRAGPTAGGVFGLDPQARLDYGYNAVEQLTPMAQALIARYYGRPASTSYLVGSSNGGRHGLMAAARDGTRFDGIAVVTPGMRLPRAAVAQVWGAQQFAAAAPHDPATHRPDLLKSLSSSDVAFVAERVLARCDALDGLVDGVVSDPMGCQRAFDPERDLPVCGPTEAGNCLGAAQKKALLSVMRGPRLNDGTPFYAALPWDSGLAGTDWRQWKLAHSVGQRDAVALSYVFSTPPVKVANDATALLDFALGFDLDRDSWRIFARDGVYAASAMDFMVPPDVDTLQSFVSRGAKLIVGHGVSDPVFSALDTVAWFEAFRQKHGAQADLSIRLYLVPGMNHSRNGPAVDQFDLVDELIAWVEQGKLPQAVLARTRGFDSNLPNPEVPRTWSAARTRLLCPFPQVARYQGGDPEAASSFVCQP